LYGRQFGRTIGAYLFNAIVHARKLVNARLIAVRDHRIAVFHSRHVQSVIGPHVFSNMYESAKQFVRSYVTTRLCCVVGSMRAHAVHMRTEY
jgi:hypothetical protein